MKKLLLIDTDLEEIIGAELFRSGYKPSDIYKIRSGIYDGKKHLQDVCPNVFDIVTRCINEISESRELEDRQKEPDTVIMYMRVAALAQYLEDEKL